MHNTPFTDMNDSEGASQEHGLRGLRHGPRVLDLLTALIPSLSIDGRRVAENIRRSCITVTELADSLCGSRVVFREAHEIAAASPARWWRSMARSQQGIRPS
jgi:argininosuccinate lyase